MKNAQLRRTLQKLVKIQNARQGSFSCKIQGFSVESELIDSSLQAVNIRARVNDDFSFPWLFETGTFSQAAGVLNRGVTNRSKSMIEKVIDISIFFDTDQSIS